MLHHPRPGLVRGILEARINQALQLSPPAWSGNFLFLKQYRIAQQWVGGMV
jgi:hypothetical protein